MSEWTHAVLAQNGDLVGVAKDIETNDYGTFGVVFYVSIQFPDAVLAPLDRFDLVNLDEAASWFREWVENEVRAAELVAS